MVTTLRLSTVNQEADGLQESFDKEGSWCDKSADAPFQAIDEMQPGSDSKSQIHQVEELAIQVSGADFLIVKEGGETTRLANGDLIKLPGIILQVHLADQKVPAAEEEGLMPSASSTISAAAFDDIWGDELAATKAGSAVNKNFIDPFHSTVPSVSTRQGPKQHSNAYYGAQAQQIEHNSILPLSAGMGQEVGFLGQGSALGMPVTYGARGQGIQSGGLLPEMPAASGAGQLPAGMDSFDSSSNWDSPSPLPQGLAQSVIQDPHSGEGNVLQDMGINEEASVLPAVHAGGEQRSFMESSPLDLMGDGMQEPDENPPVRLPQVPYSMGAQRGETSSLLGAFKEIKKRIIG